MTDQTQEAENVQEPRTVIVDDVSYVVDELPNAVRNAIAAYDTWVADHRDAQKQAAQLSAAVQHLAGQISTAIREHAETEAQTEGEEPSAGDVGAEASLDIPAEDDTEQ